MLQRWSLYLFLSKAFSNVSGNSRLLLSDVYACKTVGFTYHIGGDHVRRITAPEEWSRHIKAQAVGSKTVKLYCRENGLDLSSFYRQRRKHEAHDADREPQAFVQAAALHPRKACGTSLTIRIHNFALTLDPGYCADDLERVLVVAGRAQHVLCPE